MNTKAFASPVRPLVLAYLRERSLQALDAEHAVVARFSKDGRKIALNYDQLRVRGGDPIADQCRGLVLGVPAGTSIDAPLPDATLLAWPMCRFFNDGDEACPELDWRGGHVRVYEKLDGTMVAIYHDGARWHAATRSVPEADATIHAGTTELGDVTFAELFLRAAEISRGAPPHDIARVSLDWDNLGAQLGLDVGTTYVFELTSPWNRVVVDYPSAGITLLAIRDADGHEHPIEGAPVPVPHPRTWPLDTPASVAAFVNEAQPKDLEGAVVVDASFRRVKVKSKAWVIASSVKTAVLASDRNVLSLAVLGKLDDVVTLLDKPSARRMLALQDSFVAFCKATDERFLAFREQAAGDRKAFAELVNGSERWSAIYFQLMNRGGAGALAHIVALAEAGKMTPSTVDAILAELARDR